VASGRELDRCRLVPFAGDLQANWQILLDNADRGGGRRQVALIADLGAVRWIGLFRRPWSA
jgi:hypothetical protein